MPALGWSTVLELAPDRSVAGGSKEALADAIRRGADLRIYTEFLYEEHILPGGGDPALNGPIREVIDFRETLLIDDRYVAAITTLRQPLEPPHGFNGRDPKMSFFMYSMDGDQALANLVFGEVAEPAAPGERRVVPTPADMPRWAPRNSSTSARPVRRGTSCTTWRRTGSLSETTGRRSWPATPMDG